MRCAISLSNSRFLEMGARWVGLALFTFQTFLGAQEPVPIVPNPVIHQVEPSEAFPGDSVRIAGVGFGDVPENLSVSISQEGGRSILLRVVRASDSEIEAILGPVPVDALPGDLTVCVGSGTRSKASDASEASTPRAKPPLVLEARHAMASAGERNASGGLDLSDAGASRGDVRVAGDVGIWRRLGLPWAVSPEPFTPKFRAPPYGERWIVAGVREGRLCLPVDEIWSQPAALRIHARVHTRHVEGEDAWELCLTEVVLPVESAATENARHVADIIQSLMTQRARTPVICRVETGAGGTPELVLSPDVGAMTAGALSVSLVRAPVSLRSPVLLRTPGALGSGLQFRFESQAGRSYRIQANDGLRADDWKDLQRAVGVGGPMVIEDQPGARSMRIYRVIEE